MFRRQHLALATLVAMFLIAPVQPGQACSLPVRPEFRPPCDGQSDRLFDLSRFYPNARDEWRVFRYRLDDKVYSVYALKDHCSVNPLMPPRSLVVLRLSNRPATDGVYIIYNPGDLRLRGRPDKP